MSSDVLVRALITAVFQDGRPRTIAEVVRDVHPAAFTDGDIRKTVSAKVAAEVMAMEAERLLTVVVVQEPGGAGGHAWFMLASGREAAR